jgi:hypothetical protein
MDQYPTFMQRVQNCCQQVPEGELAENAPPATNHEFKKRCR